MAEYVAILEKVGRRVHALVERGMSEEEVVSAKPLADLDLQWSWGFLNAEAFTTIVYRDLTHKTSE